MVVDYCSLFRSLWSNLYSLLGMAYRLKQVTLLLELPTLFIISGGSDKLCELIGRRRWAGRCIHMTCCNAVPYPLCLFIVPLTCWMFCIVLIIWSFWRISSRATLYIEDINFLWRFCPWLVQLVAMLGFRRALWRRELSVIFRSPNIRIAFGSTRRL
jgi:hypothetical protein